VKTRPTVARFVILVDGAVEKAPMVMFDIISRLIPHGYIPNPCCTTAELALL